MNFARERQMPRSKERSRLVDPRSLPGGAHFWVNPRGVGTREVVKLRLEEAGTVGLSPAAESDESPFLVETTHGTIVSVTKVIIPHEQEARTMPFWSWPQSRQEFGLAEEESIRVGDADAATPYFARRAPSRRSRQRRHRCSRRNGRAALPSGLASRRRRHERKP